MPVREKLEPILFGPFTLDCAGARLLRGNKPVPMTPKAFDLLHLLASKPGRLVTKDELLSTIWPDALVSDASIKVAVSEVRKALDDGVKTPQYIETVHRRGYRFIGIGSVKAESSAPVQPPKPVRPSMTPAGDDLAGRDAEMDRLLVHFDHAASRRERQCVFITGSAGSGKTALIQSFVARVQQEHAALKPALLIGHCFEQFGTREPYLPIWEAIRALAQQRRSAPLESLHARYAATVATGTGSATSRTDATMNTTLAASRRVLGEMADAIELLADETPVLLLLEDAQWIDPSTLDLLVALARRRRDARLMVVATFRPAEVRAADDHALRAAVSELLTARLAEELTLDALDEAAVVAYLARRFPNNAFPRDLAHRLHERTDGHPLFLVHVVDDLVEHAIIARRDGQWVVDTREDATWHMVLETQVPPSVRAMIELQLDRLAPRDQQLLEGLAVAGVECSAAAAAAAFENRDVVALEALCEDLARRHRFLEPAGVAEWPDGTVSSQYRFVHELYHNVVYQRVGGARRAQLHRALGERLEAAWGERSLEESPLLATHFEIGRDWPRAIRYLRHAGDNAARHYAHREAAEYFRRALAAVDRLPGDDAVRAANELPLLMSLGVNMRVTRGCAAPEVENVYARAEALLRASGDAGDIHRTFPLLWGLWVFHKVRSDLRQADDLARRLLDMAHESGDAALIMQAHQSMCVTALCVGNPALAVAHMRQAEQVYDPARHARNTSVYGQDPGVATLAIGAVALGILGEVDEAKRRSVQAMELARRLNQPSSIAFSLHFTAMLHQLCGDPATTERFAAEGIDLATDESFSFWRAGGMVLHGWAVAVQHEFDHRAVDALKEIASGLDAWRSTGSRTYLPYFLGLYADALICRHRQADALKSLDEAIALADSLPEGLYAAPLRRLKAQCLSDDNTPAARRHVDAANRIAAEQGAVAFEQA